jgi:hypothetical protein
MASFTSSQELRVSHLVRNIGRGGSENLSILHGDWPPEMGQGFPGRRMGMSHVSEEIETNETNVKCQSSNFKSSSNFKVQMTTILALSLLSFN